MKKTIVIPLLLLAFGVAFASTHDMGDVNCHPEVCMDEDSAAGRAITRLYELLDCPGPDCAAVGGDVYTIDVHVIDTTACRRLHYAYSGTVVAFNNGLPVFNSSTTDQHCWDPIPNCGDRKDR